MTKFVFESRLPVDINELMR